MAGCCDRRSRKILNNRLVAAVMAGRSVNAAHRGGGEQENNVETKEMSVVHVQYSESTPCRRESQLRQPPTLVPAAVLSYSGPITAGEHGCTLHQGI